MCMVHSQNTVYTFCNFAFCLRTWVWISIKFNFKAKEFQVFTTHSSYVVIGLMHASGSSIFLSSCHSSPPTGSLPTHCWTLSLITWAEGVRASGSHRWALFPVYPTTVPVRWGNLRRQVLRPKCIHLNQNCISHKCWFNSIQFYLYSYKSKRIL